MKKYLLVAALSAVALFGVASAQKPTMKPKAKPAMASKMTKKAKPAKVAKVKAPKKVTKMAKKPTPAGKKKG